MGSKISKSAAAYDQARAVYAGAGVDAEAAIATVLATPISMHCWQGDDVGGFEAGGGALEGGGIQVTGSYPGKARNPDELRADLAEALRLVPGRHRVNVHAIYGDFDKPVDRDAVGLEHFQRWIDWARSLKIGLDFNATCFSHPKAADGFTLSHPDRGIRDFWIAHVDQCRRIAAGMGRALGTPALHNLWIPDGCKDNPVDRWAYRSRLKGSLDEIFRAEHPAEEMRDAVESKLFGIGSESYVVGSHEFYLEYAARGRPMVCLDMGHFHPTEGVADKISALLLFHDEILLHLSRPVRWDSDHVVIFSDDLRAIMAELVAGEALGRTRLALDFFDGSINRTCAYVTGMRATQKALLAALLMPWKTLRAAEAAGDLGARLAWREAASELPMGAVYAHLCEQADVPMAGEWIAEAQAYQKKVAGQRELR